MREDEPTTETLQLEQLRIELAERERAEHARSAPEEHAADRRAEKAAYLRQKLDEQREDPGSSG